MVSNHLRLDRLRLGNILTVCVVLEMSLELIKIYIIICTESLQIGHKIIKIIINYIHSNLISC